MKRQVWLLVLFAVLLTLAGCTVRSVAPVAPTIHFGEDICSHCGMIINEPRFASSYAVRQEEGVYETLIFDDIGEMLKHLRENPELTGVGWWVHDYASEEWIDAPTAWYVVSKSIKSPMGYGVAAFATQEAADALAAETGGKVLDWDAARAEQIMTGRMH